MKAKRRNDDLEVFAVAATPCNGDALAFVEGFHRVVENAALPELRQARRT